MPKARAMKKTVKKTRKASPGRVLSPGGIKSLTIRRKLPFSNAAFFPNTAATGVVGGFMTILHLTPKLSDIPSYQEFANLFSEYRIKEVTFKFVPRPQAFTSAAPATNVPSQTNTLLVATIYHPELNLPPPWSWQQWLEHGNCMVETFDHTIMRRFRPVPAEMVARADGYPVTTLAVAEKEKAPWIGTSWPDVAHNGLMVAIYEPPNGTNYQTFHTPQGYIEAEYTLEFRGTS